jgi:Fe-S oxidoreductase
MSVELLSEYKEIAEIVRDSGGEKVKRCYQCGLCDTVCPWNRVTNFSMRKVVREAAFGLTEIESEDIWRCTTCGRCPQQCPRDVGQIDDAVALRRMATEYKVFPAHVQPIRGVTASLANEGNPLNEKRSDRTAWAEGLGVKQFKEGMEVLYFPCCYLSYDPRLKRVARATVEVLKKAKVNFGILGVEENCCGESIRKAGNEDLFKKLARQNIITWIERGVKRILVSSPHSYHTIKNEYPEFMTSFEVVIMPVFLGELLAEGRLKPKGEFAKKVTWHDPCYLGRHNGIFEEPRDVLRQIPGLELDEMADSGKDSLCCGGGGGRIWMETVKGERFSDLRIEQAVDVGAEVLATSCPYCITNFEDSRLNSEHADAIEIKDITEILSEVL